VAPPGQTGDRRAFAPFDTPLNESVTDDEVDRILQGMTAPGQVSVASFNSSI
jgi:hypothetical protein